MTDNNDSKRLPQGCCFGRAKLGVFSGENIARRYENIARRYENIARRYENIARRYDITPPLKRASTSTRPIHHG